MSGMKNTKKLAAEGHGTLYNHGAFAIPETTISIVPPAPRTVILVAQMAGMRARGSFVESIARAGKSIYVARAGVQVFSKIATSMRQGTSSIASGARTATHTGARKAGTSLRNSRDAIRASNTYALKVFHSIRNAGAELAQLSLSIGNNISSITSSIAGKIRKGTFGLASRVAKASRHASRGHAADAGKYFIKGYAALPARLAEIFRNIAKSVAAGKFVKAYKNANDWRAEYSSKLLQKFINASSSGNYTAGIKASFQKGQQELSGKHDTGYTFALLKALRWVLQGILWNGAIKPALYTIGSLLGFVTVNTISFPLQLVVTEGAMLVWALLQVFSNCVLAVVACIAPCVTATVLGLYSVIELSGGHVLAGCVLIIGLVSVAVMYVAGKIAAVVTAVTGYFTGKIVQYAGAPLISVCLAVAGSTLVIVVGVSTIIVGGVMVIAGGAGELITRIIGGIAAGAVSVCGVAISVLVGIVLGTFELVNAILVPLLHELTAVLLIIYCIIAQLCAHALMAVADTAYMVLSLEGPNWVVSIVRGDRHGSEK